MTLYLCHVKIWNPLVETLVSILYFMNFFQDWTSTHPYNWSTLMEWFTSCLEVYRSLHSNFYRFSMEGFPIRSCTLSVSNFQNRWSFWKGLKLFHLFWNTQPFSKCKHALRLYVSNFQNRWIFENVSNFSENSSVLEYAGFCKCEHALRLSAAIVTTSPVIQTTSAPTAYPA